MLNKLVVVVELDKATIVVNITEPSGHVNASIPSLGVDRDHMLSPFILACEENDWRDALLTEAYVGLDIRLNMRTANTLSVSITSCRSRPGS
jgi:hypothetical protein